MGGLLPPLPITGLPGAIAKNAPGAAEQQVSLLTLIHEAGFTSAPTREGDPADRALLAIIARESGGDPHVVNSAPCSAKGDHAVGLTQICCPMHMPVEDAKDPRKNLAKAHELYVDAGNSFARDWPTYHKGDYRTAKDKTIRTGGVANPIDAVGNAVSSTVDAALGPVDEIASALLSADTWFRVGKGVLGGVVVIIGAAAIATIALKPLAKQAAKLPKI